jgi:hypothetical protein
MSLFGSLFGKKEDKVRYFRNLKNAFGFVEIEGLKSVSDSRILEIYNQSKEALVSIASSRQEKISESQINGLVRDLLMDEVNGNYAMRFEEMKDHYASHGIRMILFKGRTY